MKRILSLALVLVMILSVMPMAQADEYSYQGVCRECQNPCTVNPVPCNPTFPAGAVYYACSHCNTNRQYGETYHVATASSKVENTATCTEPGVKTVYCSCGTTKVSTENVPALGHNVETWEIPAEFDCTAGYTKTGECTRCFEAVSADVAPVDHTDSDDDGICNECGSEIITATLSVKATLSLKVGQSANVGAAVTPAQETAPTFTYVSSDASVAEVSETGSVTAKKSGTVTITVTSSATGRQTATCTVTITDGVYVSVDELKNIAHDATSASLSATLAGKQTGHDYQETVSYSVKSGADVISINAATGAITVKKVGKAVVTSTITYVGTGGDTGTVSAETTVCVYKDDVFVEVTMADGAPNSFTFGDVTAIEGNNTIAQLINKHNWTENRGAIVKFTTIENTDGYLTMASSGGSNNRWVVSGDLAKTKFTVTDASADKWATSFTICSSATSSDPEIFVKGVLTININATAAGITYKTTPQKTVSFKSSDFKSYWNKVGFTGTPSYVVFEGQPAIGDLYTADDLKTKTNALNKFYPAATGSQMDLDDVTYAPKDLSIAYDDEIEFTIYGGTNNTDIAHGVVVIEVGQDNPFTDVKEGDYFYDAVMWAVSEGITTGQTATTFAPNAACTRGQVVTFLWRAAGEPEPTSYANKFIDVKRDDYYYKAVLWAVEKGITTGMTATTFAPGAACTRAQVVTFLHRAAGKPATTGINAFSDVNTSAYYYDAVRWAVKNRITNGMTATTFGSNNSCTRGQIVTFLYRYVVG